MGDVDAHVGSDLVPSEVTSDDDGVTSDLQIVTKAVRNASPVLRSATCKRSWWPIVVFTEHLHVRWRFRSWCC